MRAVVRQNFLRNDRILDFINISMFYSHKVTDLSVGTKKKSSLIYNMAIYGKSLYDGF